MFWTRLLSGIVLVILAGAGLYVGGDWLFAALIVISAIGMMELYRVMKLHKTIAAFVGYIGMAAYYLTLRFLSLDSFIYVAMAFLIVLMTVYVFTYPRFLTQQILLIFFGFFYVGVMMSFVYLTRMLENGVWLVWFIFISSWVSDTFAYCVGMITKKTIGNHQMSPKLSPKKSIEGGVGGVAGSVLFGCAYGAAIAAQLSGISNPVLACGLLGGVGAVISMIGDLAASAIKRNYDIKDYGKLIPGHGGVLDRFDSVIFTAPVIYFVAAVILPLFS